MTPKICPLLALAAVLATVKPTDEITACLGCGCQWSVRDTHDDGTDWFRGCSVQFIGASTAL